VIALKTSRILTWEARWRDLVLTALTTPRGPRVLLLGPGALLGDRQRLMRAVAGVTGLDVSACSNWSVSMQRRLRTWVETRRPEQDSNLRPTA
jgi:hypothetical protein